MNANICLHEADMPLEVYALTTEEGPFIVIGGNISIYFPGYGATSIAHARVLANDLLRVADEVEQSIGTTPAPIPKPTAEEGAL